MKMAELHERYQGNRKQVEPGNYTVEFLGETPEFEDIDEDSGFVL
jgi:hypothetical protein